RVLARSLRAEGLILKIEHATSELMVRDSLALERCLVVDGRAMEHGMQLIAVLGIGDRGSRKARPVTARIADSWFVRNFQNEQPAPMLRFGSVETAPTYFESIEIARSGFLGNAFAAELELQFARQATITGSLFYKTWPSGALVSSISSGEVVIDDSVIFVEDAGHIARHGDESPPIKLAASTRIYPKSEAGRARPPAGLVAEPAQFRERASVAAAEDVIAEAVRMPATIIPGPELMAKLVGPLGR
ncbi:MAG TPA: hypothetical protein VFU21_30080, partial [Kofleriaceae bacterium]|nr:hypothetical protein [Kofleriaceae bacterium]